MIKHWFKLIWNRKRANGLILLEIVISFLVLFTIATLYIHFGSIYREPLGFRYQDIWEIRLNHPADWQPEYAGTVRALANAARTIGKVDHAEALMVTPFTGSTWVSGFEYAGKNLDSMINYGTPGLPEMLDFRLIEGRWFGPMDEGQDWQPMVINRAFAFDLTGPESAIGLEMPYSDGFESRFKSYRVIGVIDDFRQHGELNVLANYTFLPYPWTEQYDLATKCLAIRVKPGTTGALEEELLQRLSAVAPGWNFKIKPWSDLRQTYLRQTLLPLATAGIIAVFLMVMVAMGLLGVLWQNVTKRRREIGLRRAMGANRGLIHAQITGELMVMTTIGILIGAAIAIQLPLLGTFHQVMIEVYLSAILAGTLMLYGLTFICALYPSWLATRISPTQALHYE